MSVAQLPVVDSLTGGVGWRGPNGLKQVGWSISSIRFWRTVLTRGSPQTVSTSSPPATATGPSQRLDILDAFRPRNPAAYGALRGSTHPIIIKHTVADLVEDVPGRLLERQFHILARARASLYEQQAFFLGPQLCFFGRHFSVSLSRTSIIRAQVDFVADQDARQMRVSVLTDILQPRPGIQEAWEMLGQHCVGCGVMGIGWADGLCREQTS